MAATEHQLEVLNTAHQALIRAKCFGAVADPRSEIRASNVLLDACFDAGMSHDEPDHEAWAAERVARWLVAA